MIALSHIAQNRIGYALGYLLIMGLCWVFVQATK